MASRLAGRFFVWPHNFLFAGNFEGPRAKAKKFEPWVGPLLNDWVWHREMWSWPTDQGTIVTQSVRPMTWLRIRAGIPCQRLSESESYSESTRAGATCTFKLTENSGFPVIPWRANMPQQQASMLCITIDQGICTELSYSLKRLCHMLLHNFELCYIAHPNNRSGFNRSTNYLF